MYSKDYRKEIGLRIDERRVSFLVAATAIAAVVGASGFVAKKAMASSEEPAPAAAPKTVAAHTGK